MSAHCRFCRGPQNGYEAFALQKLRGILHPKDLRRQSLRGLPQAQKRSTPVGGPARSALDAAGESAGPAGDAGKLPRRDEGIGEPAIIRVKGATSAERQIGDPVELDLMRQCQNRR